MEASIIEREDLSSSFNDIFDEVRTDPNLLFYLAGYIIYAYIAPCQSSDLFNNGIVYIEIILKIFSVTPYISLKDYNILLLENILAHIRYGFVVRIGHLDHSQSRTSPNQVDEIYIARSEAQVDKFFAGIESWDFISFADDLKLHA
jgi:hypothetical protein